MDLKNLSDEDLIYKINSESETELAKEKCFKELYLRFYPQAFRFCLYYGLKREDALDSIQESFMKVFYYSSSFKKGKRFKSWFFKILYNKINDKLVELSRKNINIDDIKDFYGYESNEIVSLQNREFLFKLIYDLPKHLKDCLLMYVFQEMDSASIAEVLGISERHVRNRIKEAIEVIKKVFKEIK
ncbi:MAG: RNA polymerase sigma factor [Brevinematales bacterium]|nr:RNA polymerase sigma factor [Brevinematales bacterium]